MERSWRRTRDGLLIRNLAAPSARCPTPGLQGQSGGPARQRRAPAGTTTERERRTKVVEPS
eukprot:3728568-Prorocentrum_lima.AAC.1